MKPLLYSQYNRGFCCYTRFISQREEVIKMKIKTTPVVTPERKNLIDNFITIRWFDYERTTETEMNMLCDWVADSYNAFSTQYGYLNRTEATYMRVKLVEPMLQITWKNKKLK